MMSLSSPAVSESSTAHSSHSIHGGLRIVICTDLVQYFMLLHDFDNKICSYYRIVKTNAK